MPNLAYTVADFLPYTKIISADVNSRFSDIKTLLNTTGLTSTNVQLNGLTRDRLALGTANQVAINDGTGNLSSEAQLAVSRGGLGVDLSGSLAANPGNALIVNAGGSAITLGSPTQATLTESFSGVVSTLTAGATISANDACCVDVGFDASGNNIYRVFKADNSVAGRRRSFLGFAQAAATVTAGIYTWTASANFVTSNVITYSINGRAYSTTFGTDNATTLQAVATQMATDPDVSGAVSNGAHVITVTGKGGLTIYISGSVVTSGASQATIAVATTTTAAGQNVLVQCFGPLAGFTSLTTTSQYYLSTAGTISTAPADSNPIQVGQALSSTVLFISNNSLVYQFGTPANFIRSHGASTKDATTPVQDVEHYNFTSWSAGTSSSAGILVLGSPGDHAYQGFHYKIDGTIANGTNTLSNQAYNKSAWATKTNRGTVGVGNSGAHAFNTYLYAPNVTNNVTDKWNGTAWSATGAPGGTALSHSMGLFTQSGSLHMMAGAGNTRHYGVNTSDVYAVLTVNPGSGSYNTAASSITASGGYFVDDSTSNSYQWSGSWGSAVVCTYTPAGTNDYGAASGYNSASSLAYINGGSTGSVAIATSAQFNATSWASATSSSNARSGSTGSVI